MPAKANSGRLSSIANHVQTFLPVAGSAASVGSQKLVTGTRQRNSGFIHARQCGELVLRMFVTPRSIAPGLRNAGGVGMPHRAPMISRSPVGLRRTMGACLSGNTPGAAIGSSRRRRGRGGASPRGWWSSSIDCTCADILRHRGCFNGAPDPIPDDQVANSGGCLRRLMEAPAMPLMVQPFHDRKQIVGDGLQFGEGRYLPRGAFWRMNRGAV